MTQINLRHKRFQDCLLTCCDCDTDFVFTAGEQVYFASKKLSMPKRCKACRERRQASLVPDPKVQNGI